MLATMFAAGTVLYASLTGLAGILSLSTRHHKLGACLIGLAIVLPPVMVPAGLAYTLYLACQGSWKCRLSYLFIALLFTAALMARWRGW